MPAPVCLKAGMGGGVGQWVGGGYVKFRWINSIVLNSPEGKYELLSMTLLYFSPIKLD